MQEQELSLKLKLYRKICAIFMKQLPDELYIKLMYQVRLGLKPNLRHPTTFNEKLNWLKLHDRNPLYTRLADKYEVKGIVSEKIGTEYVIPLIGVWDRPEDIDFGVLPNEFVLKCTHDSGSVIICRDKEAFDIAAACDKLNKCLSENYYYLSREWVYKNIKPRIICEPYVEDFEDEELRDYKLFCFDGHVKFLYVATDRFKSEKEVKFTFFDSDFNRLDIRHGHPTAPYEISKPDGFEEMKRLAEILSEGIPHVRVDFYEANGKVLFSEFTFYNNSGFLAFEPREWDERFGEYLRLSTG